MQYFSPIWCDLSWTDWIPFTATREGFGEIPRTSGVYRVRPVEKDFLMYIGQTGRSLHERLNDLRRNTLKPIMPFNDPHTAAPSLWAWRDAEGYFYECSAATLLSKKSERIGWECYLLWNYRLLSGSSTLCNFGRFHHKYWKSTNRKQNQRGGRLPDGEINISGGPSLPPLQQKGNPGDTNWMGLGWSEKISLKKDSMTGVPHLAGFYLLVDQSTDELVYIGQSKDVHTRLLSHSTKYWDGRELEFAFNTQNSSILPHNLKELENDLIGCYFAVNRKLPRYNY